MLISNTQPQTSTQTSEERTQMRRVTCSKCEAKSGVVGIISNLDKCRKCGCNVLSKTSVASSSCPYGKW